MRTIYEQFDVAVIGAGPAGLMAAGRAAQLGYKVALLDKNKNPGKKLLLSGNGRCNITNAKFDDKKFVAKLGQNGPWLFSALSAFGPKEIIEFFASRGLKTRIENDDRVFPVSGRSQDVLDILLKYLKTNRVKMLLGEEVVGLEAKNREIASVKLHGRNIYAKSFILATGGKTYPITGSTGDGYKWARELGHKIINPYPSLVAIKAKETWLADLSGIGLKNVGVNLFQKNKWQSSSIGEILFTHFGLSGPAILNASKRIGKLLPQGEVTIGLDLFPTMAAAQLDKKLQTDFARHSNQDFKNYLPAQLPQKLMNLIIKFSGLDPDKKLNSIKREERKYLAALLKNIKVTVTGLMGFAQAIVTTGGVDLKEIDSKTLRSKKVNNLFLAGEILDLDGPTGGYNLQICWSTGYAAGTHAVDGF